MNLKTAKLLFREFLFLGKASYQEVEVCIDVVGSRFLPHIL